MAADFRNGDTVTIKSGETVNDDLYLTGADVTVDGTVNGDLVIFAQRITINGTVNGNINVAGQNVTIKGTVSKSVRSAGAKVLLSGSINGDLVALCESLSVAGDGSIGRDLVVTGGTINVEGPVNGNLKSSSGKLLINSNVGGNVEVETNQLKLGPSANINGNLVYTSKDRAAMAGGSSIKGQTIYHPVEKEKQPSAPSGETIGQAIGAAMSAIVGFLIALILIITLIKYGAALLTGIILIVLAKKQLNEIIAVLKQEPWPCLGWGALLFIFVPVAIFIAFILIVGIPLGSIALAIYIIGLYLAHIITALFLGKWILGSGNNQASTGKMIGALALGLFIVYLAGLIPFICVFTDLAVILFGFGAILQYINTKLTSPGVV